MSQRRPMTQVMTTSAASKVLPELVQKVSRRDVRVVVEQDGKPLAAIISAYDLARLAQLDARRAEEWQVFVEIHARNSDKDPEEVERDVAEAIAEMRQEERAKRNPHAEQ
jgi:prevent-host-death family protein